MFLTLLCVHILFYTIANANKHSVTNHHRDASSKFANLLKDIVSINERRFEAMKELARLQEYSVTKYHLRSGKDFDEQKHGRKPLVLILLQDRGQNIRTSLNKREPVLINKDLEPYRTMALMTRKSQSSSDSDEDSSKEDSSVEGLAISRKSWHSGCGKKMSKVCKKACRRAYKNVCMTYTCSSRIKKSFRKECKRTCKDYFTSSKYSDSDSDGYVVYDYNYIYNKK